MKQQKSIVKKMGDILIKEDVINLDQLKSAIQEQKHSGRKLGETLLNLGYIDENQLVAYLSKQYAVPAINLEQFEVSEEALKLVPRETAFKHKLVPIDRSGSTLVVAMADPSNIFAIDDLKFATGQNIEVVVASERSIKTAIESHYGSQAEWDKKVQVEKSQEELGNLIGDIEDFVDRVRFYSLLLSGGNRRVVLFRKYNRNKELMRSKYVVIRLLGERYERLSEPTFQFDQEIDALLYRNHLFILNKANFQHIFHYYELLAQVAEESLTAIQRVGE